MLQVLTASHYLKMLMDAVFGPLLDVTFKKAPRARKATEEQIPLSGTEAEDEGPF